MMSKAEAKQYLAENEGMSLIKVKYCFKNSPHAWTIYFDSYFDHNAFRDAMAPFVDSWERTSASYIRGAV